jgi:hypothetical protein
MAYPAYVREKARELRRTKQLTIDQLADQLALSRSTIYYWVRDMPIPRSGSGGGFSEKARRKGNRAMRAKYRRLRDEAYELGRWEFPRLARDPTFRDFVCLYIAEGYKRSRNSVQIANSDPAVIKLGAKWIRGFSSKRLDCSVQYHADQNLKELKRFWSAELGIAPDSISLQRKSNSSQLKFRKWRCRYGVLAVRVNDTRLRARLQGWIDSMKEQWLDSLSVGA